MRSRFCVRVLRNSHLVCRQAYRKRIVSATVDFLDKCTVSLESQIVQTAARRTPPVYPCESSYHDSNYTLEVRYFPLSYLDLLNDFEFSWDVYFALFLLIGIIVVVIGATVWGVNRLITRLRHPPKFRMLPLLKIIGPAPVYGVLLATIPAMIVCSLDYGWFFTMNTTPDPINLPNAYTLETSQEAFVVQSPIVLAVSSRSRW